MKKHSKICLVTESKSKPVTSNFVGPWDANTRSSGSATSPKSVTCCDRRCLPWFEVHTLHLLQLFKIKKKKICQKPGAGLQSSLCGLWPFQGRHSAGFSGQSSAWLRGSAGSDPSGPFQPRLSVWLFRSEFVQQAVNC